MKKKCCAFHKAKGDVNIYIRGVIHQIPFELRPAFITNIKHLMGNTGAIYLIETAPNIQQYIRDLAAQFSGLPLSFKRVLTSNLPPLGISMDEVISWFPEPEYQILDNGPASLATNITIEGIKQVELPAIFALVKRGR